MAQKGDIVKVNKSVMGKKYGTTGKVTATQRDRIHGCLMIQVNGDWWLVANDIENSYEMVDPRDKRPRCHYCGLPANRLGFFGEPVCRECS
jgi:hypothetical protein